MLDLFPGLAEYFARYNLDYDVPFEPYTNGIVSFDVISQQSRGAIRPAWELLYAHYVQIKGVDAPWTTAYLNNTLDFFGGFEGGAGSWGEGSGHYDGLGWGSLLHHLDESDLRAAKSSAGTSADIATIGSGTATGDALPNATTFLTSPAIVGTTVATGGASDTSILPLSSQADSASDTSAPQSTTDTLPSTTALPEGTSRKVRTGCVARRTHARHA
ncbi:hypothetical protein NW759_017280 [Fusarium solani]|nr:hypothetical protein NW759_017280 [Fusarium solani]